MNINKTFQAIYLSLLILWLVVELAGIIHKPAGDTFSEYVRLKTRALWMHVFIGGLLGWLIYHFLFARNGDRLSRIDFIATLIGMEVAYVGYWIQNRGV